jgi:N-acetyl-gamma-glutamylphosphate reductase
MACFTPWVKLKLYPDSKKNEMRVKLKLYSVDCHRHEAEAGGISRKFEKRNDCFFDSHFFNMHYQQHK